MRSESDPAHTVVRGAPGVIVTPRGDPVPPQDVVAALQKINPRYSLEWVKGAWGVAYYGLFAKWLPNDPRWQRVQSGEISERDARDIEYMFPPECSPAEMRGYVEQRHGMRFDPRAEADKLVARAQELYAQSTDNAVDTLVQTSMERRERESNHDLRVRGGLDTPTPMSDVKIDLGGPKRLIPKE